MSVEVTVKLSKNTYELLEMIARENHTAVEELIRELIVEALIEHGYMVVWE